MSGPIIVRGYHGTTRQRVASIIASGFDPSTSAHSWLGEGRYFFQDAPIHAYNWECNLLRRKSRSHEGQPVVIQVNIDISQCMDLMDATYWGLIRKIYENSGAGSRPQLSPMSIYIDKMFVEKSKIGFNYEDFIVMQAAIQIVRSKKMTLGQDLTTVRAAFIEGNPVHPNSWLFNQSCVAISVIDPRALISKPIEIDVRSIVNI